MTRNRNLWLAPALLGAFWMARGRAGRGTRGRRGVLGGQSLLSQLGIGSRPRSGGLGSLLLGSLMGRRTAARWFR